MLTLTPSVKLWYAPDPVDFRLGFDGLFTLVKARLAADPMSGQRFIFRNRTADRVKVLYWGGHGLCLWCSRLEVGRYHFPDPAAGAAGVDLTAAILGAWTPRPPPTSHSRPTSPPSRRWSAGCSPRWPPSGPRTPT